MKISKHVSLHEGIRSQAATRRGLDNTPNEEQFDCMVDVATAIFEPLRTHFGVKVYVSSFFRGEALNKAIRGSKSSQHCKGQAMDIDADVYGKVTNRMIFEYILENLDFDQLIWEFGDENNPSWVHVSYVKGANRGKVLRAVKGYRKTIYQKY